MSLTISGPALANLDEELLRRANAAAVRLAQKDATLWGEAARNEAEMRLGWIDLPIASRQLLAPLQELQTAMQGRTRVVLCGMGGSSLAPEVIAASHRTALIVVDTTDPNQIAQAVEHLDQTVFVIASKSGTTIETDSQRRYFIDELTRAGLDPRRHIVVVTDPESALDLQSREAGLHVINADPTVGGRFSALSAFGLTPTVLLGIEAENLLIEAQEAHQQFLLPDSPAVLLAVAMAQQARTTPWMSLASTDPLLAGLGDWIEQLVAESSGKAGGGVLPVVVEGSDSIDFLASERLSVALGASASADLSIQGGLGAQFQLWEWATALLGFLLESDPFNQPNVTESKTNTGALLHEWNGALPTFTPDGVDGPVEIFGARTLAEAFDLVTSEGYVAIMAYLNRHTDHSITSLRPLLAKRLLARTTPGAVTFGWGPRFLHSTGQFHKGGPQIGAFLQITGQTDVDLEIPGAGYGFSTLQMAQALGDVRALASRGRPVVRLHLREREEGIKHLLSVALAL
jgi:glucose-6-phosphate isomerase